MATTPITILGIDPGYGRIGWGVIEGARNTWVHKAHGCIMTDPKQSLSERLCVIQEDLQEIITRYSPQVAGVESLFFKKNVTTALQVAHARGVMLVLLQQQGIILHEITPLQVKQSITGYGKADKLQVQHMVSLLLGLKERRFQDDAADALAVAFATTAFIR